MIRLKDHYQRFLGSALVFMGAICFSAKAVMVKMAYIYKIDVLSLLSLRMLFSVPFFLIIALYTNKKHPGADLTKKDWVMVVLLGITGYYLASWFDFEGLQYITAGLERLILFIYPTLVVILSAIFLRKRIGRKEYFALALTYAGILIVFVNDLNFSQKNIIAGILLIFGSALTYAIYLMGSGELIPKLGSMRYTSYAMIVSTFAVLVHFEFVNDNSLWHFPYQVYWLSLVMAIFSTVIPGLLLSEGIRMIGSGKASIIASIGPVSTIMLAYIFLDEKITFYQILGTMLVLAGVLTVSSNKK